MRPILLATLLLVGATHVARAAEQWPPEQFAARVTFYTLRGVMASGLQTRKDAAACSKWMPFGTQLRFPDGYVVTCLDRGHGDWYWPSWIDVWSPTYSWGLLNVERDYGLYATVSVLSWGWE